MFHSRGSIVYLLLLYVAFQSLAFGIWAYLSFGEELETSNDKRSNGNIFPKRISDTSRVAKVGQSNLVPQRFHAQSGEPFDPMGLPPNVRLTGKYYPGCPRKKSAIIEAFDQAKIIVKDQGAIESANSGLLNIYRLEAYDYDEVKGLVVAFNNALIYGVEPVVFDCQTIYRPGGAAYEFTWHTLNHTLNRQTLRNDEYDIKGTVILLSQFWCEGYYHWFIECLPRLAMVKDYLDAHPDSTIIMHRPPKKDLMGLLSLIGIQKKNIVLYRDKRLFRVEHLLVPTATAEGRAMPRAAKLLNGYFREAIARNVPINIERWTTDQSDSMMRSLRIVIQQRLKGPRSMTNGDELVQRVKDAFPQALVEEYTPSSSVWDMLGLHYYADLVIAPHGAGEANAIFMRPGAHLLEIYMHDGMLGVDWINPCHRYTANAVGVTFHFVRATSGSHETPMMVDIPVVLRMIEDEVIPPLKQTLPNLRASL